MEGMLSEFDYFEPQVIQAAILDEYDRDFAPLATLQHGAPIEFLVRGADNLYLDLNNSKIEIKCKITKPDGAALAGDNVGPVNLALHSMFSGIEMELCGKNITDATSQYPYRAFFETLLNWKTQALDTRGLSEGWLPDTHAQVGIVDITGANTGLKNRAAWFALSAVVTFIGRPHLDLFHQEKDIPAGCDLKLRLSPSKDAFVLVTKAPAGNDPQPQNKLDIVSARLFIRTKEVSPDLIEAHQKMLMKTNYRIPYTKVTTKHISIPTGQITVQHDNVYTGQLPDRVIVALVSDADMTGSYTTNPFNFGNFGLCHVTLRVNGQQVPRLALAPNFATGDYIREYMSVLEAVGYDVGNQTISLKPVEWASGFTFYVFKITPGPIGTQGPRTPPITGAVRLNLKFAAATTANINIVLVAQSPALLEIDKYRNVIG